MNETCKACGHEFQSDYWETCPHCYDVSTHNTDDNHGNFEDQVIERITQLEKQSAELRKQVNEALKALRHG